MSTRRRVGRRNAIYAQWLAFRNLADAEALVRDHPRLGLNATEAQILSEIATREAGLLTGATSGRFNLGPLEHRARVNRAREYLDGAEALEKLQRSRTGLTKLKESLAAVPGRDLGGLTWERATSDDRIRHLEAENQDLLAMLLAMLAMPRTRRERDAIRLAIAEAREGARTHAATRAALSKEVPCGAHEGG